MLVQQDTANVARTISQLTQVDTLGTVRSLTQLWQNDGTNTPRLIFNSAGAVTSLTPTEIYGYGNSTHPIIVSTTAATVSGFGAGATYVWNFDTVGWSAINPGASSTSFRKAVAPGDEESCEISCTVTVGGAPTTTNSIIATVSNIGGSFE